MPSLPRSPFGRRSARAGTAERPPERDEPRVEVGEAPGLRWINIERPRQVDQAWLEERFEFHPLDYEDVYSRNQRPKVDEYDDYLFCVLHFPAYDKAVSRLHAARARLFPPPCPPPPPPEGAAPAGRVPVRALPHERGAARLAVLEGPGLP